MWPWEHLAVGYLLYSLYARTRLGMRPTAMAVVAVAFGTQFPDLVDKPLAWVFTIMPDGTTIGHSVFVAVPLAVVGYWFAKQRGRPDVGVGFGIGHLSHLPGDIFYPAATGGHPAYTKVLWPVFTKQNSGGSVVERVGRYSQDYLQFLLSPEGIGYLSLEFALVFGALALWVYDGVPGLDVLLDIVPQSDKT